MTEPYTAADVQLVAEALSGPRWKEVVPLARAAVAALAEAGRLAHDGAERIEEWTVAYTQARIRREAVYGELFDSREDAEQTFAFWAKNYGFTDPVFYWRERLTAFGPWVEADEEST